MYKLFVAINIFVCLINENQGTTSTVLSTNSTPFYPTSYPPFTNTPESTTSTTTESTTTSTTTWSTPTRPPTLAPTRPPVNQLCCGHNEVYLRQGEAPNCDPVCSDLAKKCDKVYVQAPSGCYCIPGYCRLETRTHNSNRCIAVDEAMEEANIKCYLWH